MKHRTLKTGESMKFEVETDLVEVSRVGARSWIARIYEAVSGGGHADKAAVQATGSTALRSVTAAFDGLNRLCAMRVCSHRYESVGYVSTCIMELRCVGCGHTYEVDSSD